MAIRNEGKKCVIKKVNGHLKHCHSNPSDKKTFTDSAAYNFRVKKLTPNFSKGNKVA